MVDISITLLHGLLICIPFTIFVAISFVTKPRLWLHSLPADIQQRAPQKTARENIVTRLVLLPIFIIILPGLSTLSAISAGMTSPTPTLSGLIGHLYLVWIIVHFWDLIVIDGIAMLLINPAKPPIAGTEYAPGWTDIAFHIRSFGKAVLTSAIFVLPAGVIIHFFVTI
jgi:hypothetical protein